MAVVVQSYAPALGGCEGVSVNGGPVLYPPLGVVKTSVLMVVPSYICP